MEEEIPTSPPNPGDYEKEDDDLSPNMEGLKISEEFKHQGLALLESSNHLLSLYIYIYI